MSTIPVVIGQGTYGCVHKPSLKCKDETGITYTDKVSKILTKADAKKEVAEYTKVSNADKHNHFYLGKPETCEVDNAKATNLMAIQKCHIGANAMRKIDKYQLILMEDGGENLETYTKKMGSWSKTEMSTELCEKFILESLRLFAGLKLFNDKGLIHYDLKPQNIVYNEKTNRLNFIDFGIMKSKKPIKTSAAKSKCSSAFLHWSYPWELELLNKRVFDILETSGEVQDKRMKKIYDKDPYEMKHINTFFYYAIDKKLTDAEYQSKCNDFIHGYEMTLRHDMREMGYDAFLDKSVSTIDVYGVGIAMNYWIFSAKKHLDSALAEELANIFKFMVCPHLKYRYTPDEVLEDMENVIIKSGLLAKYDKEIVDHIVVNSTSAHRHSVEKPFQVPRLTKPDADLVNADPAPCPEGKERSSKTGRCIKIKVSKDLGLDGPCPEGKERNPKTGRCIKAKVSKDLDGPCPDGKERSPKTRRCIKKCNDGYNRDDNFRCTRKIRAA